MTFKVGARVARNDKPEEEYTVEKCEWGLITLEEITGAFNPQGFHVVLRPEKKEMGILDPAHDRYMELAKETWRQAALRKMREAPPLTKLLFESGSDLLVAVDPNDEMLTEDENEEKRKEFDAVVRQHSYKKAVKELREVQRAADEFWDGVHLSDAIKKTTATAKHPQAMWSVQ